MKNATRFLSILLCILLLAGTAETALAEAVTLNIYVSGETDTAGEGPPEPLRCGRSQR